MLKLRVVKVHGHPSLCLQSRLRTLMLCIVLHGIVKTLGADSNSCDVSKSTVKTVEDCPVSEEKWREAAAKKNCSAFANQCSEPDKLVYHCVINEYVTQTLEVCAYAQKIVLRQCTSYSISGNLIQQNSRTNCGEFTHNPCPLWYWSDVAYKYPECYKLIKKSTVLTTNSPKSTSNLETTDVLTTIISSNYSSDLPRDRSGKGENTDIYNTHTLAVTLGVIYPFILFATMIAFYCRKKKIKKLQNNKKQHGGETHPLKSV